MHYVHIRHISINLNKLFTYDNIRVSCQWSTIIKYASVSLSKFLPSQILIWIQCSGTVPIHGDTHVKRHEQATRHFLWQCECTWKWKKYATAQPLSIDLKIWAIHFSEYLILAQSHITVSMSIILVQLSEVQTI